MKILIVCSGNPPRNEKFNFFSHHVFIHEQIEQIKSSFNISFEIYSIKGKGIFGYLRNIRKLIKTIRVSNPDIIHAHYGTSGLLSIMQFKKPVIITFHGSDINDFKINILSSISAVFANHNIFVSNKLKDKILFIRPNFQSVIPCGIDFDTFFPIDKLSARQCLNWPLEQKAILFSSAFTNPVKNSQLAKEALKYVSQETHFVELKNRTRQEVNLMLNACDLLLLTSFSEGSPQIIKEAMATNCPIVATDVGDVKEVIGDTIKIQQVLGLGTRTNGRDKIIRFNNKIIALEVFKIYQTVSQLTFGKR
jgi:glycosyltransferase involved in cell wall biosynthesis